MFKEALVVQRLAAELLVSCNREMFVQFTRRLGHPRCILVVRELTLLLHQLGASKLGLLDTR